MRLSKAEVSVLNALWTTHTPMSITELSERSSFRFARLVRITIAVERLVQKGVIIEAGIHQSYSTGKEKCYIAYALTINSEKLKKNVSHGETQIIGKENDS